MNSLDLDDDMHEEPSGFDGCVEVSTLFSDQTTWIMGQHQHQQGTWGLTLASFAIYIYYILRPIKKEFYNDHSKGFVLPALGSATNIFFKKNNRNNVCVVYSAYAHWLSGVAPWMDLQVNLISQAAWRGAARFSVGWAIHHDVYWNSLRIKMLYRSVKYIL